jgi:hypothetical protein
MLTAWRYSVSLMLTSAAGMPVPPSMRGVLDADGDDF